ncbi:hypothetical protein F5144DRAFT_477899 [Chaetomium tenue]|uniref:Uncharacterized protein n=1 Tax=Chaetomium tenue TaxID=1854479 RepID=A0ACB7PP28_9PEZI|nr:hypothetical protein F5144DRAFT_477899 [Chaetomium globosum]
MADAPPLITTTTKPPHHLPQQRGPLSSVISATKRLSFDPSSPPPKHTTTTTTTNTTPTTRRHHLPTSMEITTEMEVTESPADAPGSGRRRPLRVGPGTPLAGSSALLQRVMEEEDLDAEGDASMGLDVAGGGGMVGNSSPIERRVARRGRAGVGRGGGRAVFGGRRRVVESVAESVVEGEVELGVEEEETEEVEEAVEEVEEEEEVIEESTVQLEDGQTSVDEVQTVAEQEVEEAQEVGEEEAAQRLGRKRPRRSPRAPSPELGSGVAENLPAPKRRRGRPGASPAQQQQPAKKARVGRPPKVQPPRQPSPSPQPEPPTRARAQPRPKPKPKPKPKAKKQARKSKAAANGDDDSEGERPSGSVPVTVQRFTKPSRVAEEGGEPSSALLHGEIPFASRGGVNAVDVLSKLCEELIEAYMDKLQERGRAAEDAATRREQKTMYRALEAFQEELRTRLLEHTIALDTLHSLRKRVRSAQKEKLTLRDEILQIRAEREQVALRMDAIRIRHEADSKQALRHISLSSAMHDIDMAVEKGQAAPELSPAEQKKADLANLELLISRVADQACTKSDGGGALKQIREFNAFLERAAAVLEGR